MRKLNMAVLMMTLLLAVLSYVAVEGKGEAQALSCQQLTGCCGATGCQGPGTPDGCNIQCQGGGSALCCSNRSGKCLCGPSE